MYPIMFVIKIDFSYEVKSFQPWVLVVTFLVSFLAQIVLVR